MDIFLAKSLSVLKLIQYSKTPSMLIIGLDQIKPDLLQQHFTAKMVFNAHGALFFPTSEEHQTQSADQISYEDNYKGNAMAAMLAPNKIEIRYHKAFTDAQVARIIKALKAHPELVFMSDWQTTYQGRPLEA